MSDEPECKHCESHKRIALSTYREVRAAMYAARWEAREKIGKAFRDDPDFRRGYVDNVACVLLDNDVADDGTKRNLVADLIVKRLFEE